ncbi:unnamed protein product [Auanema sp. JU1783]|nr:unnamed protein product [Auanema sp. JU1783]
MSDIPLRIALLTVSDTRDPKSDLTAPAVKVCIQESFSNEQKVEFQYDIVRDEKSDIVEKLRNFSKTADVILTLGGTGFGSRDVTPEATLEVIERRCSGLEVALHTRSLEETPMAALSRAVAGIYGNTLIVNFPGSPKAVPTYWKVLKPILPHGVKLLRGNDVTEDHAKLQGK